MAERRMFSKTIIDSDSFLDMPLSTQSLYFHLSMRGDDEGFVNNPKKIQRMIGASDDDMRLLMVKNFIISFESGVVVIKHWKLHNYIQKDRFKKTVYQEEKALLSEKNNGVYTLDTECIQNVYSLDTQDRLGKDSIGKDSIDKNNKGASLPVGDEKPKAKKKEPIVYYPNDSILNEAFSDYVEMRKKIKATMTERAVELTMKKLEKLSGGDNDKAISIIDQSIMNGWKGLFPLSSQGNTQPNETRGKMSQIDAIMNA